EGAGRVPSALATAGKGPVSKTAANRRPSQQLRAAAARSTRSITDFALLACACLGRACPSRLALALADRLADWTGFVGGKHVARAAYGLDDLRVVGIGFDLAAQTGDADVDAAVEGLGAAPMGKVQELIARQILMHLSSHHLPSARIGETVMVE